LVSCIDELSLRKQKPGSVFLEFFIKWHPVQLAKPLKSVQRQLSSNTRYRHFFWMRYSRFATQVSGGASTIQQH